MSDSLLPHGLQHARLPCPSLSPRVCSDSCQWCHPTICCPLLLLPSIFPSIRVFSGELTLCIRWPRYWSFGFSISPSSGYSGWVLTRKEEIFLFPVSLLLSQDLRAPPCSLHTLFNRSFCLLIFLYQPLTNPGHGVSKSWTWLRDFTFTFHLTNPALLVWVSLKYEWMAKSPHTSKEKHCMKNEGQNQQMGKRSWVEIGDARREQKL